MDIQEGIKCKGTLCIEGHDKKTGKRVFRNEQNLIVTIGKAHFAKLLAGQSSAAAITYMAVGTNNTAADAGQTLLLAEVYREAVTPTIITTTTTNDTAQFVMTIDEGDLASGTLVESGLFGSEAGSVASGVADTGIIVSRVVYPAIVKTASLALTFTWSIQFT